MNQREKKVTNFLYTSVLITTVQAGYSLIKNDYIDAVAYLNLAVGFYGIANSLEVDKNSYIKNIKFYENSTKLAAFSCILIPDFPYEPVPVVISLFIGGNMYLFSKIYKKESLKY